MEQEKISNEAIKEWLVQCELEKLNENSLKDKLLKGEI
jgi:hypothetical protein